MHGGDLTYTISATDECTGSYWNLFTSTYIDYTLISPLENTWSMQFGYFNGAQPSVSGICTIVKDRFIEAA